MDYPDDSIGFVLNDLVKNDIDLSLEYSVSFRIEFESWPLSDNTLSEILALYPNAEVIDPTEMEIADGVDTGSVKFSRVSKLTHDFICRTLIETSDQMRKFGGSCDSWGFTVDKDIREWR